MQWEAEVNRQDNDIEEQVKRRIIEIEEEKNETPVSMGKWPASSFEAEKGGRIEEQVKRRVDEIEGGKKESIEEQVQVVISFDGYI